jgi:Holliday junction resolvase
MSDIATLFTEDPLKLTKENLDEIIAYYRNARAQFTAGVKSAGATKKMKDASSVTKITNLDDILGDL